MADHLRSLHRGLLLFSLASPAFPAGMAHAQGADATARKRIHMKAYSLFSYVRPDFGGDTNNKGGTFGGNIDGFSLLPHTELGIDVRYTISSGIISNQYYFGGGPRISLSVAAFGPYVDLLVGHGKSIFNNPSDPTYTHDDTSAISYGGGFDYKLTRSWALRADLQRQRWRFSTHQPYFSPVAVSVGASYELHFRNRTGPGF